VTVSSNPPTRRHGATGGGRSSGVGAAAAPGALSVQGAVRADRGWEYWKQLVAAEVAGQQSGGATAPPSASPDQAIIDDLVLANRMLASKELGILDAFGHVSVRNPRNPSRYFISRYVSAGVVKASDVIENNLDSQPARPRSDEYQEVYIHGRSTARPDVMGIARAIWKSWRLRSLLHCGRWSTAGLHRRRIATARYSEV
jgi:hypothetical protein